MSVAVRIQVHALVHGALDAHLLNAWHIKSLAKPPRDVLIRWLPYLLVQMAVVKLCNSQLERLSKAANFGAGKARPSRRQCAPYLREKTVAVKTPRSVPKRKNIDLTSRFEPNGRYKERSRLHLYTIPKR